NAPHLRFAVRDAAAKIAGILIQEGGPQGGSAETSATKERIAIAFCKDFCRRVSAASYEFRLLQPDFNLYWLLRDTLINRARVLISQAIDRHAPNKATSTMGVKSWTSHFTAEELEA